MDKNNRDYTNGEITVHWRPSECVHATICYVKLRKVFDPSRRPWVKMDGASTDKIIEIVNECPTNALTFSWNKDLNKEELNPESEEIETSEQISEEIEKKKPTKVQIIKNGPAIISGDYIITDINGNTLPKADAAALCRCGNSANMPYCDGTHNRIYFKENR